MYYILLSSSGPTQESWNAINPTRQLYVYYLTLSHLDPPKKASLRWPEWSQDIAMAYKAKLG